MSLTNEKKLENNKWELEITINADDFKIALTKAYKKNVKSINVQGFRKGKAPQSIVERLYGEDIFFNEAIDIALPEAYAKALSDFSLEVVSRPELSVKSATKKDGVVVMATVYTKPSVEIKDYKGLEVDKILKPVTDEEIEKSIEEARQRNSRTITVEDRKTKTGDITVIDFEGFCDGVAFDGGKGTDFSLTLGSGQFIKGFEEQLVGFNVGDDVEVNVTFPEEYHSKDLAGKESLFKVKIKEVKAVELPELDDEFAKDVSEFDTLKEYKDSVKEKMIKSREESSDKQVETHLVNMLADKVEGEIPEVMYDLTAEEEMNNFSQRLKSQGMSLEMYLQYTNSTPEMMKQTFKEQAVTLVKSRLALSRIVELEKITSTPDELVKEYEKLASSYNMKVEEVKKYMNEDRLVEELNLEKAVQLVKDSAKITVKEEADEEKPKKKVTAKKTTAKKSDDGEEKPKKKTTVKKTTVKKVDDGEEKPKKKTTVKKTTTKKADSEDKK